nr:hypothetical protein [uncultured Mediterranean phage uvMED]
MSQLLTQKQFADHKGVSESYVSQWIKRDEVPLVKNKLDLEVADRYWNKRPRNRAKMVDFNTARTTKMIAEARTAEMHADEMQGKLVRTDSVLQSWERSFSKIKTKLQSLPTRLGPQMAIQSDPKLCTAQLKNEIGKLLNELSRESRTGTA